ncbi:MAG TPA: phytoene desaturase family protein [Micromonosporaceae bacterium]|nr:phytoene desaturase family protein [Micromonosporaceae bacterium]
MRRVQGPTDRVVVVGAGLGGLACAIRLAAAGREVTIVEREDHPGGRAGRLSIDGYEFDTGPTVLTMPDLLDDLLSTVGETLADRVELTRLDPAYRAHFPDGSTLDVITDTARMAAEVSRVCGPREADGYLRFVDYARSLWQLERRDFIDRNLDSPRDLVNANLLRLLAQGGFRRLSTKVNQFFSNPRTRRIFSFQAMYAGVSPQDALALYSVIAYLDSVAGVYFPRGGIHAVPRALAGAAEKAGVTIHYGTTVSRVETSGGRATGVIASDGRRFGADVVVLNPDLPVAYRDLLPGGELPRPRWLGKLRYSPSCAVLHVGSTQEYRAIAHHNIHFGRAWRETFDEVIHQGRLMSDPSLLVTNPSRSDPSVAPAGRQTYYVLAPTPNLDRHTTGAPDVGWRDGMSGIYRAELINTIEQRGYVGFGAGIEVSRFVTPADWADAGMAGGTPFASAHTMRQTGPFRPGNLHPTLSNVVFVGSGTQPGVGVPMVLISGRLAAQRVTGAAA